MKTNMTVSAIQLFWIMTLFEVGMAAFLMVSPTIQRVHADAWISLILSGLIALLATWIGMQLGRCYPLKTFIEYLPDIVGTWLGKTIGLIYVIHWVTVTAMVYRQVTTVLMTFQFHTTPIWFFVGTMAFLSGHVLSAGGLRSLGRVAEVTGPIVLLVATVVYLFSLPNVHWKNLMPMYVNSGMANLFHGSIPAASFLAQSSFITMLYPFLVKPKQSVRAAYLGVATASLFVVISAAIAVSVFSPTLTEVLWNPVLSMTMYISVGDIFQNVEAFVMIVWFLTAFIRMVLFLFLATYGLSQLIGIHRWQSVIWWMACGTAVLAMLPKNVIESSVVYPETVIEPFVLPVLCFALPISLWVLAKVRTRGKPKLHS